MFDLSEYCSILVYARPGHGKTNFVKFFLNNIPYKHLHIITSSPAQYENYAGNKRGQPTCKINWDYEPEEVEEFLEKKGVKVIVFDDFLHLNFNGKIGRSIKRLLSTTRHTQTYIISSCQNLTCIGKTFRYTAKMFLTGSIDDDSVALLELLTRLDKHELREIKLNKYEFILAQANGDPPKKIKLNLQR